jgi:hypothetical protein
MTTFYQVKIDVSKFAREISKHGIKPISLKRILDNHIQQYIRLYKLKANIISSEVIKDVKHRSKVRKRKRTV